MIQQGFYYKNILHNHQKNADALIIQTEEVLCKV